MSVFLHFLGTNKLAVMASDVRSHFKALLRSCNHEWDFFACTKCWRKCAIFQQERNTKNYVLSTFCFVWLRLSWRLNYSQYFHPNCYAVFLFLVSLLFSSPLTGITFLPVVKICLCFRDFRTSSLPAHAPFVFSLFLIGFKNWHEIQK